MTEVTQTSAFTVGGQKPFSALCGKPTAATIALLGLGAALPFGRACEYLGKRPTAPMTPAHANKG